jgi:hypothetical protein
MTIRLFGALLCGVAFLLATQADLAQAQNRGGFIIPLIAVTKGEKSDHMGGGGKGSAARTTAVKSSKFNTSDRMGGRGEGQARIGGTMPGGGRLGTGREIRPAAVGGSKK